MSNNAVGGGENGFAVEGHGNRLVGNVATGYSEGGISVSGEANVLVRNTALDNGIDLIDTHEECDDNRWQQNVFRTSQAGAIDNPACIQ